MLGAVLVPPLLKFNPVRGRKLNIRSERPGRAFVEIYPREGTETVSPEHKQYTAR
mgnify:CR=1 FL=1